MRESESQEPLERDDFGDAEEPDDDDDLMNAQEHQGFGEDEGERDESFDPD